MFSARDICFDGKVVGNVVKMSFFYCDNYFLSILWLLEKSEFFANFVRKAIYSEVKWRGNYDVCGYY